MRFLSAVSIVVLTATSALAEQHATHPFDVSHPAGAIHRIVVDIPAGDVTIRNGPAATITIKGYAERSYDDPADREESQRVVDDVGIEIVVHDDEATIQRKFGPAAGSWRTRRLTPFHIELAIPPSMGVDVNTQFGDVNIDGRFGDINIDMRAGDINLRMPRAAVRELNASCRVGDVHARFGDRIVDREGILPAAAHFENPQGSAIVNLHVTAGDVDVRLTN